MRKALAILGSTGSVGANALAVALRFKDKFEIRALSADSNIYLLAKQTRFVRPKVISVRDDALAREIKKHIPSGIKVLSGQAGLREIASRPDVEAVLFATSGSSCATALLAAIDNKKNIALANKESLVSAGSVIMAAARKKKVKIIPIDSEHSAIFQCLEGRRESLNKIYLTGSGGPLLNIPKERFDSLSKEFILRHPRWRMGKKISVDSATMMNKGLEIIEARWLFDVDEKLIEVLIHPEAVVHSMVELVDGAVFAQLGVPDMRIPIQYALAYPQRLKSPAPFADFKRIKSLTFMRPDKARFPCLEFGREAARAGGTHPAVLNAADEEAVKGYLEGRIKFSGIPRAIGKVLKRHKGTAKENLSIGDIVAAEEWAREEVKRLCYH
jgi:1-deoxy-D-xylulose-5-phosphate reductoisomerase